MRWTTDKTLYHTTDKLGSAVLVINTSGVAIENNRTLPYGEQWLTETASANDKKFTTYQRDAESGLDYAGARYYSNAIGRFASKDMGRLIPTKPRSLNRYAYTLNDPVNFFDPDGNEQHCDWDSYEHWTCDTPDPVDLRGEIIGNGEGPRTEEKNQRARMRRLDLSTQGLDCVKAFEGLRLNTYADSAGKPTIGYGHLIRPGDEDFSNGITEAQATQLLAQDVANTVAGVRLLVNVPVTQNQFDAIVSLAFNIGLGKFEGSELLTALNSGQVITEQHFWWRKVNGEINEGLANRRAEEWSIFTTGKSTRCP